MPTLVAAIVGQESSYCRHKHGIDKQGFGCGQMHTKTAKKMLGLTVTKEALEHDDFLNMYLVADLLSTCASRLDYDFERTVYCYNHGLTAARKVSVKRLSKDHYVLAVTKRMVEVEDVNMMIDTAGDH
jgi:hypothetical protein